MPVGIQFGIVPEAIQLRAKRAEIIANNLANADTPGFKARDIDFRQVMNNVAQTNGMDLPGGNLGLATTHSGHISGVSIGNDNHMAFEMTPMQYRIASQPSVDGNTVDTQIEKAEFAENQLRYQQSVEYLDSMVKGYKKALIGN